MTRVNVGPIACDAYCATLEKSCTLEYRHDGRHQNGYASWVNERDTEPYCPCECICEVVVTGGVRASAAGAGGGAGRWARTAEALSVPPGHRIGLLLAHPSRQQ